MRSMLREARMVVRREQETPTVLGTLIVGLLATLFSFAIVDGAFFWVLREVFSDPNSRSRISFTMPSHNLIFDLICFFVGVTVIGTKKWVLPLAAGLVGFAIILPMYGGSGPVTNFMSLIELHLELLGVALLLNLLFAVLWIRQTKPSVKVARLREGRSS